MRGRKEDLVEGAAELLLSFAAAYQHIPQQRRLRLFCQLANSLGPEDCLHAIISLLALKCSKTDSVQKFISLILAQYGPAVTLKVCGFSHYWCFVNRFQVGCNLLELLDNILEQRPNFLQNIVAQEWATDPTDTVPFERLAVVTLHIFRDEGIRNRLARKLVHDDSVSDETMGLYSRLITEAMNLTRFIQTTQQCTFLLSIVGMSN